MDYASAGGGHRPPTWQGFIELDRVNPISGTRYETLPVTAECRVLNIAARCTWTVQPTPLEVWIEIDGQTLQFIRVNPVSNTWYYTNLTVNAPDNNLPLGAGQFQMAFIIEGRSVQVLAEITIGTVSRLQCRLYYGTWP